MKISIITTTFNRKGLIKETIESVRRSLPYPLSFEWEHIIYDDASTDDTSELFKNSLPNTVYIQGTENKGPSYGRNRAVEIAMGEYIFLLDSDDIVLQRTLYNFVLAALANP